MTDVQRFHCPVVEFIHPTTERFGTSRPLLKRAQAMICQQDPPGQDHGMLDARPIHKGVPWPFPIPISFMDP